MQKARKQGCWVTETRLPEYDDILPRVGERCSVLYIRHLRVGRTTFLSETFFISSAESHFSQYETNHPEAPGNAGESREHYAKKIFENEYNLEELERHKIMLLERGKKPVLKKKPLFIFFRASREFI